MLIPYFKGDIKIDGPKRKQIWKDWQAAFPSLAPRYKTSWSRRVGPVLISIGYSYEYGNEYRPGFYVFNLSNPLDFTCANLDIEPNNRRSSLNWRQHEYGLYLQAVEALREQAPIPIEGPVTLSQVIQGYKAHVEKDICGSDRQFQDPALIAAWAGKPELAAELFEWGRESYIKSPRSDLRITDSWCNDLKETIANPEALLKTVEEQVIFHKLTKIPYEELIIDL